MRTRIFTIIMMFLMLGAADSYADKPARGGESNWKKELRDFKLKFLAQEMELREDQQKQFFTLYSQMNEEKENVMESARTAERRLRKMDNPSEEDYRKASDAMKDAREREMAIEKKYDKKFRSFLTSRQMYKMKEGERKFRDKLHELRHNPPRGGKRGQRDK